LGSCPTFLSEAKPTLLFVLIQKVSKKIKAPFYLFRLRRGGVGIIFACKIATFRVIFETSSQLPERFPHFAAQK
jgi:hypothetical protein